MKTPRILLGWDCDGIGCNRSVQIELPADLAAASLNSEHQMTQLVETGGCRVLGRSTLFCPHCANPTRRAPESLQR